LAEALTVTRLKLPSDSSVLKLTLPEPEPELPPADAVQARERSADNSLLISASSEQKSPVPGGGSVLLAAATTSTDAEDLSSVIAATAPGETTESRSINREEKTIMANVRFIGS